MKHTWNFVRKSETYDHPDYFDLDKYTLLAWAKCRGVFQSKQTGELTHKKIDVGNLTYWAKRHYGMSHEEIS